MTKSTDAEMELRVSTVYDLLLSGTERAAIVRYAAKTWNVQSRIVDTYLRRAKALLAEHAATDRTQQLGMARARLNMLFAKALANKSYATALAVQRDINTLEALYAPPAERTLKLIGMDSVEIAEFAALLEANGMKLAEVVASMKLRLAQSQIRAVK
jgi:hypothetical protein